MSTNPKHFITPEEYLEIERAAEVKHEYFDGELFAMVGGSRRHSLAGGNICAALHAQLEDREDCEVHQSDLRVKIPATGLYTYPDVVAVCGGACFEGEREETLLNPTIVIEALSPSTEDYDRRDKFDHYSSIAALAEYLLVAQDKCRVEHRVRQGDAWLLKIYQSLQDVIELKPINCGIPLSRVYRKVKFRDS